MTDLVLRPEAVLEVPLKVAIPDTIEEVHSSLNVLGGAINAGGWATAAEVWAWTERGNKSTVTSDNRLTFQEFTALKIRGLSSPNSVRKYRAAWDRAIGRGWAHPVQPGDVVTLPTEDFRETEAHVGANSGENEWYTPREYIEAARKVMGTIDLDPASSAIANELVQATAIYTAEDDGLKWDWVGNVWMNPPYAQPLVGEFADKLVKHYEKGDVPQACVLVNNATDTAWFQTLASVASAICFPRGRVRFWEPGGALSAPLQGQAIVYLGGSSNEFQEMFADYGFVVFT